MTHLNAAMETVTIALGIDYSQAYLFDDTGEPNIPDHLSDNPVHPLGIINVRGGVALLTIGTHYGRVPFDVQVARSEPAPDLGAYEDIVEISFASEVGSVSLHEWGDEEIHRLPPLPAGPGWYRLRYHAYGLDEGHADFYEENASDRYLLQIWPADESGPRFVKSTSSRHRSWIKVD
ncbi:hypothetical protein AB0M44_11095 [Streptosporangium subroseum]|uniref:hypothetical protein n=1 Tax=Streptosporangium subroseum TaxID=106412 RepID=UPI0034179029